MILSARIDVAVSRIDDDVLEPTLHTADGLPRLAVVGTLNQTTNEWDIVTRRTATLAGPPQNVAIVGIGGHTQETVELRRKVARQRGPRRAEVGAFVDFPISGRGVNHPGAMGVGVDAIYESGDRGCAKGDAGIGAAEKTADSRINNVR